MATDAGVNSGGMVTVSHSHAHRAVFEDKRNVFAYGLAHLPRGTCCSLINSNFIYKKIRFTTIHHATFYHICIFDFVNNTCIIKVIR